MTGSGPDEAVGGVEATRAAGSDFTFALVAGAGRGTVGGIGCDPGPFRGVFGVESAGERTCDGIC